MRLIITIEVHNEEIADGIKANPRQFRNRVQAVFDEGWPYARMGSIEVVSVDPQREPSETDKIGPLG